MIPYGTGLGKTEANGVDKEKELTNWKGAPKLSGYNNRKGIAVNILQSPTARSIHVKEHFCFWCMSGDIHSA